MEYLAKKISEVIDRPIVFVGLMGAGKTTIGKKTSRKLGLKFNDLDKEIEKASGISIVDLFALYGEDSFRKSESAVLARVLDSQPKVKVISTGEGAFLRPQSQSLILKNSISIWLKADLDLLVKRTAHRDTRPHLLNVDARAVLKKLIDERYPIYEKAEFTIETKDEPLKNTVEKVLKTLGKHYGV